MAKGSRVGTRENFQVSSITDLLLSVRAHRAIRGLQPAHLHGLTRCAIKCPSVLTFVRRRRITVVSSASPHRESAWGMGASQSWTLLSVGRRYAAPGAQRAGRAALAHA